MGFNKLKNKIFFAIQKQSPRSHTLLFLFFVFLTANLNALADLFLRPEARYFDKQHLLLGGIASFLTAGMLGGLLFYMRLLEKSVAAHEQTEAALREATAERKRMEAELVESERRFRSIFENVNLVAVMLDHRGNITFCNDFLLETTGWKRSGALGRNWFETFLPDDVKAPTLSIFTTVIATGKIPAYHENEIIGRSGERRLIAWYNTILKDNEGKIIGIACVGEDITGRRQAEEEKMRLEIQLRQAQKMEAVGQLAGGVAHDFNNILTAISGYASLALMKMKENVPLRHEIEEILAASDRAANLTHSLLAYSRRQIINPKAVNLNTIVTGIEKLLSRVIGEDIEFRADLASEDLTVMADTGQLEQVLMNLATNARDAMPEGGLLLIETSSIALDAVYTKPYRYMVPGRYALMSVTDTGTGMDEKTREKIFDPFFTTKEIGKGTGLGLAMVYGIIKQQNGYINVYSEPGKGTTFKIYLPLIERPGEKSVELPPAVTVTRSATILLAEDDAAVRTLMRTILEEFDYTVMEAANGEEAVDIFARNGNRIDLVILDVVMPKMNGMEAYLQITKARPDMKVLFTSGYTANIVHTKRILDEGLNFISKPVTPEELIHKIQQVLSQTDAPSPS